MISIVLEISRLHRVRFAVPDLAQAAASYERLLARSPSAGSPISTFVLFQLDNMGLELVPESPAATFPGARFQVSFATEDLSRVRAEMDAGTVAETTPAGELILSPDSSGGLPISICECEQEERSSFAAPEIGAVEALDHLVVRTRDADACRQFYEKDLGLRVALDRSFEDFGMRLIFCRVGGVTVEIASPIGKKRLESSEEWTTRDSIYGFSWRVPDIEAAHARLVEAGLDVSSVRKGRRPGTHVFTVRDRTCGVPTLVLGIDA